MSELDEAIARLTVPKTDVEPSGAKINCNCDVCILRRDNYRVREALEITTSMLEALQVQLNSWGHESAVNARGQIFENEQLLVHGNGGATNG